MADGQVIYEIVGDAKGVNQTVKQVTSNIQAESKKWDQAASESTSSIENAFGKMATSIAGKLAAAGIASVLLSWGNAALETASDLAEVQNVVDTVFGDGASTIESWAKKAGTQFGLTEIQAKKFTSTLGAMMKSSGLAGDQILGMSTDLAGLAADMASFYNLDFETAFEKIRAGISGETMPLKQLGIDMSVANLNAFALAQGLGKTYDKMSQGEQVMLRYQYLMQATADAQGDFEKTADGFANAQRRVQTALETLSSTIGGFILTAVEPLVSGLADILGQIMAPKEETLFDKVAKIDIDAEKKIAKIQAVASEAAVLIEKLNIISGTDAGDALGKMAEGANKLNASTPATWEAVFKSLQNINGLQNIFGPQSSAAGNITDLANALSGASVDGKKAEAWKTFLGSLSDHADAVSKLTGKSVEETKKWLDGLSESIDGIDVTKAEAWDNLLTTLVSGFSTDTPEGRQFVESLSQQFLAMGNQSTIAAKGLETLGFDTDQIANKQEEWLKVCRELVKTIPGLSDIVNTETGEIRGGIGALNEYVEDWRQGQEKLIYWKAYYAKVAAQQETASSLYSMEIEAGGAQYAVDKARKKLAEKWGNVQFDASGAVTVEGFSTYGSDRVTQYEKERLEEWKKDLREYNALRDQATEKEKKYKEALEQNKAQIELNKNEFEFLSDKIGLVTEEELKAADAAETFGDSTVKAAQDGIQAINDYYKKIRDVTAQTVNGTINGFDQIKYAGDDTRKKQNTLAEKAATTERKYANIFKKWGGTSDDSLQKMAANWNKLSKEEKNAYNELAKIRNEQKEVNTAMEQYSATGMQKTLQDQLDYMDKYLENLKILKSWGVSGNLIAYLSDGSEASAEYLAGLVAGGEEEAKKVGVMYDKVQEKKEGFISALTENKLAVDETYQGMVDKMREKVGEMDMYDAAKQAAISTMQGIIDGISSMSGDLERTINTALTAMSALTNPLNWKNGSFVIPVDGSHETGLNYVPFNGYLAQLHEGEGILTAEENRIWQRFKNGQNAQGNVDYDALGGVMRDNVKAGGNVYLDGRTVGRVVSEIQGNQYRTLKRSGWQQ